MAALEQFTRQTMLHSVPHSVTIIDTQGNAHQVANPVTRTHLLIANEMRRDQRLAQKQTTIQVAHQQHDLQVAWAYSNNVEIQHPHLHSSTRREPIDDTKPLHTALVWDDDVKPLSHREQILHDFYLHQAPRVLQPTRAYASTIS